MRAASPAVASIVPVVSVAFRTQPADITVPRLIQRLLRLVLPALALAVLNACTTRAWQGTHIEIENDKFTLGPASDRHYTQGARGSKTIYGTLNHPTVRGAVRFFRNATYLLGGPAETDDVLGITAGQSIYTPKDTERRDLILDDRPYAGWLYGGAHLISLGRDGRIMDTYELQLGMTGPSALAKDFQNGFHELIGVETSKGWDNQLANEFGGQFIYRRSVRMTETDSDGVSMDLIGRYGTSIGTIFADVNAGATLRIGYELPPDFGPSLIRTSLPTPLREPHPFSAYVFAGADGRFSLRNTFLDGNLLRDSHDVSRSWGVADFFAGIAIEIHGFQLSITQVARTPEFREQDDFHRYVALSAGYRFTF